MLESIKNFFTAEMITNLISVAIGLVAFFLLFLLIKTIVKKILLKKGKTQIIPTVIRVVRYVLYVLVILYIFNVFNINISALLGAAGIIGVAVSFASQTSLSNIISGFFIISEHALKVGDYITVDGVSGTVTSVELLSVRIKTSDNQMARIPNEKILNANLQNTSFYPTRRITLTIPLSRNTDLDQALEVAKNIPEKCPQVLSDPEPAFYIDGFNEHGINLVISAWLQNSDLIAVKNQVYSSAKKLFEAANIEIAYPRLEGLSKN